MISVSTLSDVPSLPWEPCLLSLHSLLSWFQLLLILSLFPRYLSLSGPLSLLQYKLKHNFTSHCIPYVATMFLGMLHKPDIISTKHTMSTIALLFSRDDNAHITAARLDNKVHCPKHFVSVSLRPCVSFEEICYSNQYFELYAVLNQ